MPLSPPDESAVQPSPPLIAALHRRLRDPSIVPRFETLHQLKDNACDLVRPRWVMCRAHKDGAADNGQLVPTAGDIAVNTTTSLSPRKPNTIPQRNFLDLRMEQNKMFAEERYEQYTQLNSERNKLADIKELSARGNKEWEMMKSCIREGLGAYPDHKGLLQAQTSMNYMESRLSRQDVVEPPPAPVIQTGHNLERNASQNDLTAINKNTLQLKDNQPRKKGAEGRSQAAIRDALLERSFLSQGASTTAAVGEYTLLPEEDEANEQTLGNTDSNQNQYNDASSGDSRGSSSRERHRRHQKRRKEHGREKKRRKHHKHERKKHRRHEGRRRSRKRSRSSSLS